ncbi:MAG: hypothetical protein CM15mP58_15960 [Burkholderiaceae bacterium]|nr:MAG: hypothetical protein CM15mP58_15960 [Burkholderiaceae bacterium]
MSHWHYNHESSRYRVIDIHNRAARVSRFHVNTVEAVGEMLESTGIDHPVNLTDAT